jgi:hypothetical protein
MHDKLVAIPMTPSTRPVPSGIDCYIREAEARIHEHLHDSLPKFQASDPIEVFYGLLFIKQQQLATGNTFCEWGSGLGTAAGLASLLGFDAIGYELEASLVSAARDLCRNFDIKAVFRVGDYAEAPVCQVVYAYPWPEETQAMVDLFVERSKSGDLLMSYHGIEDMRLHRKT